MAKPIDIADVNVTRIGAEEHPVVVIDNYHPDPDGLRQEATTRRFARTMPFYPGIRAGIDAAYYNDLARRLAPVVQAIFEYPGTITVDGCCFSLVTTPPKALAPIQRMPHYDGLDPMKLAALHYLSGADQGGTAFYRHRETGFESLNESRFPTYRTALEGQIKSQGLPPPAYATADMPLFEQLHHVAAKPNRLVLYQGHILHSGVIPDTCSFSEDPARGRLTVNTFLSPNVPG